MVQCVPAAGCQALPDTGEQQGHVAFRAFGVAGVAAASTAGNAAAVPAIVAAANPAYADAAGPATILVAACVVVTAILVPIVTAWTAKAVGRGETDPAGASVDAAADPAPVRRA